MREYEIKNAALLVSDEQLLAAARAVMKNAYVPYSGCKVGAALVSASSGRIYSGCNVENASYPVGICAERNAISTAVASESDFGIAKIAVINDSEHIFEPCGMCLQTMCEFMDGEARVLLSNNSGSKVESFRFRELLPKAFVLKED